MYASFFDLPQRPFSLRPDPAFFYRSHKATLVRHLLRHSDRSATIGFISNKFDSWSIVAACDLTVSTS
jgi:hypothetical protein